jgi:hypothetical protein
MNDLNKFLTYARRINEKWQALPDDAKERYYMDGTYSLIDEDYECYQLISTLPTDLQTVACELILNALDVDY